MAMRRGFSFSKKHPTTNPRDASEYNLKLDPERTLLPQIPQNWEGSGNLMGQVFLENLTLFLELVTLNP